MARFDVARHLRPLHRRRARRRPLIQAMTLPQPLRAFASSPMKGYNVYRVATCQGVHDAGHLPVCAEDFPSRPASPRNSCLDGVKSADVLVLLLGERYGFVTPSGKSATEEEYEEAKRLHKPIYAFRQEGICPDEHQQKFIAGVEDYVTGHHRACFSDPLSLAQLVAKAMNDAERYGDMTDRTSRATSRLEAMIECPPNGSNGNACIQSLWTTARVGEVMDALDVISEDYKRSVLEMAHVGDSPIFAYHCRSDASSDKHGLKLRTYLKKHDGLRWAGELFIFEA